jgi:hypothetical protein
VPLLGPKMVCTNCGTIGADVRPNWLEKAKLAPSPGPAAPDGLLPPAGTRDIARRATARRSGACWQGPSDDRIGEAGLGHRCRLLLARLATPLQPQQGKADQRKQDIAPEDDAGIARREIVARDHLIDVAARKAPDAMLYAFDLLEFDGDDLRSLPLDERKARLMRLLWRKSDGIVLNEHTDGDGATVFRHACKRL